MTTQELFNKYDQLFKDDNNKYIERVDPTNRNQCFDLAVHWCEYLGLPNSIFSGLSQAKQIWIPSTNIAVKNFTYIDNTPDAVPQKGDMVVWSGDYNAYWYYGKWYQGAGHVGMCTGRADINSLDVFEQNDPTGTPCHIKTYDYNSILGWLRFKTTSAPPPLTDTQKVNKITIEIQSGNSDGDVRSHIKNILGL